MGAKVFAFQVFVKAGHEQLLVRIPLGRVSPRNQVLHQVKQARAPCPLRLTRRLFSLFLGPLLIPQTCGLNRLRAGFGLCRCFLRLVIIAQRS